jgi:uncharacterized protein YigA (DUF484 family)
MAAMSDDRGTRHEAHEMAQWLRRHPRFLEQFPDLAVTLVVPKDGGASASLAGYQLEVLREKNRELTRRLHELGENAQLNERLAVRTHQLTLALMRAGTPADTLRTMVAVLGEDFAGDAVRVLVPVGPATPAALAVALGALDGAPWLLALPAADPRLAAVAGLLEAGEPQCGRPGPERQALLFGSAGERAASAALLPVAGLGLVAIGSADPNRFYPGMGTLFLRMMAEALATALARG